MVDAQLFRAVLAALRPGAQLVLVGDVDQLPSVGAGAVLADVIASEAATVIRLTEIFRQAAASKIVVSAHRINQRRAARPRAPPRAPTADFYFIARDDPEAARATIVELVAERIPRGSASTRSPTSRCSRRCTAASSAPARSTGRCRSGSTRAAGQHRARARRARVPPRRQGDAAAQRLRQATCSTATSA